MVESLDDNLKKDIENILQIDIVPELLDIVCQITGMGFSAIARVTDKQWITCSVQDNVGFGLKPGDELSLKTTICDEIRDSGQAVVFDDAACHPVYANHHTPAHYGLRSYISVPVIKKDGSFFGTLCAIDAAPQKVDTPVIRGIFTLFARLVATHLDIIEQDKQSREALEKERVLHRQIEENEVRLNMVMDAGGLGIWELDLETMQGNLSERYLAILGFEANAKPTHKELLARIHPEDLPLRNKRFSEALITGKLDTQFRIVWQDGSVHWIDGQGKVLYNKDGSPARMMGTIKNVTREKTYNSELEKKVKERTLQLEESNAELERMNNELQSFAYVASHDLQEPLRKIRTFTKLLLSTENEQLTANGKNYFNRIQNSVERMQDLINDLLSYSRTNSTDRHFETIDLLTIIEHVKAELKEELQQKEAIVEVNGSARASVVVFQFQQLLYNLMSNSLKFSKEGSPPHIIISIASLTGAQTGNKKLLADAYYCHISIKDNGIGFEQEYEEKIFELFQRLHGKAAYNGTGIGLAIVKKIVELHGGIITATGIPNEGAVFDIYIPQENN